MRGWLKAVSFTEPADNLFAYSPWRLRSRQSGETRPVELLQHRRHGKGWVVQLEGIEDRDAAARLQGLDIVIARDQLPPAGPDSYYWADLEGLEVETTSGIALGSVDQLLETGSADVLVVIGGVDESAKPQRTLVPFVPGQIVHSVDLADGKIVVDWDRDEAE